jgi:hypothetical protein
MFFMNHDVFLVPLYYFSDYTFCIYTYFSQLKMEREAGRVFKGWKEGKIYFAPTYKYAFNSDTYYAEGVKVSKNKRRTPAWYVSV